VMNCRSSVASRKRLPVRKAVPSERDALPQPKVEQSRQRVDCRIEEIWILEVGPIARFLALDWLQSC
jgi:hypothetical protein